MSLLAGPRRKQIISSNPQGKTNNDNWQQFGKKLMGKSGWQEGDGLGPERDGACESLAMRFKDDTLGLGCSKKHEQNWLAHSDDFNALLSSLNATHGTEEAAKDEDAPPAKIESLEEKSRNAKGRIHYHKFTRGKDLSSKSSSDISSIFGGKLPSKKSAAPMEPEAASTQPAESRITGLNTIESKQSIHDYFSKKMAMLKNKRKEADPVEQDDAKFVENVESAETEPADDNQSLPRKSKKQRKAEKKGEENQVVDLEPSAEAVEYEKPKKKKRRGDESLAEVEPVDLQYGTNDLVGESNEGVPMQSSGEMNLTDNFVAESGERKKKKKRKDLEAANEVPLAVAVQDSSDNFEVAAEESEQISDTTVEKVKRKKSKKTAEIKEEESSVQQVESQPDGGVVVTEKTTKKTSVVHPDARDNGEVITTTTMSVSVNRTNFSLNMRGIRAKLNKMPESEKQLMFPGSNVFDIAGYGDHHFF